jgi:hypothetical protein
MPQPFRWNIAKREQLGRLVEIPQAEIYPDFLDELEDCCSRVIAFCDNSDLIFVGRSPESLFDYLSGLLAETSWASRCSILNISARGSCIEEYQEDYPKAIPAIREQLEALGLSPEQIVRKARSLALVDIVSSGSTFGNITALLTQWHKEQGGAKKSLRRKLRYVGLTLREKTSPKTWRWQQQVEWAKNIPSRYIKNVSVSLTLAQYLASGQDKVSKSNPPWRWGDVELIEPPREIEHLRALGLALALYERGTLKDSRQKFSSRLSRLPSMKHRWYRALVTEIRKSA